MRGLYGNATATALEDAPIAARGILSGLMQQGYAFGYLLATVFSRALVNTTNHGWRPLYWFGGKVLGLSLHRRIADLSSLGGPPVLIIIFRLMLPEPDAYLERERIREESQSAAKTFLAEGKVALKHHYILITYMILFMAGFNFLVCNLHPRALLQFTNPTQSHGSQDLYPTMLSSRYKFSADKVTVTQVVANLGAICGGILRGYISQIIGRRLTILIHCIFGGALLYPYTFVSNNGIIAATFFEQFCVQGGIWRHTVSHIVSPMRLLLPSGSTHLSELSPPSSRAFIVGTTYQLGSLTASASSTIEATLGERFPLPPGKNGVKRSEAEVCMSRMTMT